MRERRALDDIAAGGLESAIAECSNIWMSLPGDNCGQHQHGTGALRAAFIFNGGTTTC